jgi:hypothetical protein
MSRKVSNTCGKNYRIFYKKIRQGIGSNSKKKGAYSKTATKKMKKRKGTQAQPNPAWILDHPNSPGTLD